MVSLRILIVILLVFLGSCDARRNTLQRLLARRQLNNKSLPPPFKETAGHGPMNLNISSFDRRPGSFFMALTFVCKRLSDVAMNARYKRQRSSMPVEAEIFEEMFGPLIMKLDAVCESLNIVRATLGAEFKNAVDFTTFRTHTMTYPQFMNITGPPTIPIGFVTGAPQSRNGQMKKRLLDVLYKYLA